MHKLPNFIAMRKIAVFALMFNCFSAWAQKDLQSIAGFEKERAMKAFESKEVSAASSNFSVQHYRFYWEINPSVRFIKGQVTPSFTIKGNSNSIRFDLADALTVDSVLYHGTPIGFNRAGNQTVDILFPSALADGKRDSLSIFYSGVPPVTGFGSFTQASHAGVPIIWTLSEPYGSKDWWPCRNGLDDKADSIDAVIVTPDTYFASFNGMLIKETISNGSRTVWWKHRYPIATYLVALAATNYQFQQDTIHLSSKILPLEQFVYPESAGLWQGSVPDTRYIMRLLENKIGPYPFSNEKYGHTQVGFGGGMEHQTNSFMGNASPGLITHELAHQWFGNKLTCGSWQHIWLNEGFATFLSFMYYESVEKKEEILRWYKLDVAYLASQPGGSVFVYDTTNPGRIFDYRLSYLKGSWVLQMLKWKLGENLFYEGLKAYLNDTSIAYGFARTEDLQRNLERVSVRPLGEFFKDWVYGEGYPQYEVRWMPLGNSRVQLTLNQTTSHPSVSFFEMPVPIRFKNSSRDSIVVVDHLRSGQSEIISLGFIPDSVIFDPLIKIVSANNKVLRADASLADQTIRIFPNPVGSQFSILLANFNDPSAQITIHNAAGQLMYKNNASLPAGNELLLIPSLSWSPGVYFVRVKSASANFVQRIVK
jgi:aminopeptidase N